MPLPENILAPIPGDNPGGANLSYSGIFEQIREARREDDDLPAGDWSAPRKVAEHQSVIRLTAEAIATQSKDLQLAGWLTEALLKTRGLTGFSEGLAVVHGIVAGFWDYCYPLVSSEFWPVIEGEDENSRAVRAREYDLEREDELAFRAARIGWLDAALEIPLRMAPITDSGLSYLKYEESREVGYEVAAGETGANARRFELLREGKLPAAEWDSAERATNSETLRNHRAALESSLKTLKALDELCEERFGDCAPSLFRLRWTLETLDGFVRGLLLRRRDVDQVLAKVLLSFPPGASPYLQ